MFRLLETIASDTLVPELLNRADTKDPIMRTYVTKVMSKFDTPKVTESLGKLLSDENKAVRLAALEGLSTSRSNIDIKRLCALINAPTLKCKIKQSKR